MRASPNATGAGEEHERERRTVRPNGASGNLRQLVGVGLLAVLVAALAVFGIVQWRSAADAKGDVDHFLTVADLVAASESALLDDPELSLLLATQAVRETVDLGFATEEAIDAVHFSSTSSACSTTWATTLPSPSVGT